MRASRSKLEQIKAYALERLMESRSDDWSYLSAVPPVEAFGYCLFRFVDNAIWHGETIWLRGEVSDERLVELANPEAKLTRAEDALWRRNLARWYATRADICSIATLVPVSLQGNAIDGYAIFVTGQGHPADTPAFEGAFETRDAAIRYLQDNGAIASLDPWIAADPAGPLQ